MYLCNSFILFFPFISLGQDCSFNFLLVDSSFMIKDFFFYEDICVVCRWWRTWSFFLTMSAEVKVQEPDIVTYGEGWVRQERALSPLFPPCGKLSRSDPWLISFLSPLVTLKHYSRSRRWCKTLLWPHLFFGTVYYTRLDSYIHSCLPIILNVHSLVMLPSAPVSTHTADASLSYVP
jgi:hypothetical protein